MYAIDRGMAGCERLPLGVLHATEGPLELPTGAELLRRHGERWLLIEGRPGAGIRALHAPALLVIARRGTVTLAVDGAPCVLEPGRYALTEPGARIEAAVAGPRDAGFVALALPARAMQRIATRVLGFAPADPVLFAELGAVPALLSRDELEALERALDRPGAEWAFADVAGECVARLVERQRAHASRLARTSGRTDRHRRHLYARLNRVRLAVEHGPTRDYTMRELAEVAHLSVWHFVRSFGHVHGETPHRYLTRVRLEAAGLALRASTDPIAVVAERHGFDNRCAFARLFRAHFGVSASQYRRAGAGLRTADIPGACGDAPAARAAGTARAFGDAPLGAATGIAAH